MRVIIIFVFVFLLSSVCLCQTSKFDSIAKEHRAINKKIKNEKFLSLISFYWKLDSTCELDYRYQMGYELPSRLNGNIFHKIKYEVVLLYLGTPDYDLDFFINNNSNLKIRYVCSYCGYEKKKPCFWIDFVFNEKKKLQYVEYIGFE